MTTPDATRASARALTTRTRSPALREGLARRLPAIGPYLQALPLAAVFVLFFAVPISLVVVVSFFDYETYQVLIPDFTFDNYREVFSEEVTYRTY
jgi:ABC-type sugar transport system permease subunit